MVASTMPHSQLHDSWKNRPICYICCRETRSSPTKVPLLSASNISNMQAITKGSPACLLFYRTSAFLTPSHRITDCRVSIDYWTLRGSASGLKLSQATGKLWVSDVSGRYFMRSPTSSQRSPRASCMGSSLARGEDLK